LVLPQPGSNRRNGKKIYGKKMGRAALKTLAHFSASDFFAIRFSNTGFYPRCEDLGG
jgi:hypothetical protein